MDFLKTLGIEKENRGVSTGLNWLGGSEGPTIEGISPVDGNVIASVFTATEAEYDQVAHTAHQAFFRWRQVPAPKRGEVVRRIGRQLRAYKEPLGTLVSYEMGKSLQEGLGEVQEMIDICDFAVGQSRQLYGYTMHSERPEHRMYDQYHPLGVVGIVSAFNFPVAVWAWNAMLAAVCGDASLWKPSSKAPLSAIAVQHILADVLRDNADVIPEGLFSLVVGSGHTVGQRLLEDTRVPIVSVTGSTRVGRHAAQIVASRFGRAILELGGNNAIIVTPAVDMAMAVTAIVFGAVGTAGQRCTSTRRVIIHESIYDQVVAALTKAYASLRIGTPLNSFNHMGPLIDTAAVADYRQALAQVSAQGGKIIFGGQVLEGPAYASGCYVQPTLCEVENDCAIVQNETFAPILYLIRYSGNVASAIAIQNDVPQGLSSAIFTNDLREAEAFLSATGSDCGIANVNIGTSGAEIGGAFGGEKETGGGRESGSDAWKGYMRRQTNTINYGRSLPLAQGLVFDI
ncbi:aldehyde dehydrogenase family protein [Desulfosarcina sp.]|uniref:L-piperidine-6-carboxylate dehydrogenase n=1 Tax=Desulfosarcina sp. TaxID=2027861 RepID=UPI0029B8F31B|nr:aldehyde dehydrogenase family protein [Desulfosarcina sp.]MDX2451430.1 aldehyde dehydrogenase family protein [Desulfosarcina sp.]MDX2489246.1 aldehyde dehydrogenase family protein [Desulfosarcina sp.]